MLRSSRCALLLALLAAPVSTDGRAIDVQDPQASAATTLPRVTLVQSVGPPDGIVAVPLQFAGREDRPVASITVTIVVPSSLTFTKAEIGGLGISAGAEVKTSTERQGADTRLQVTISTPEKDTPRLPLPDGPIAQLMFKVAKTMKPETVVPLKVEASGLAVGGTKDPVAVSAGKGEIVVANKTVISCFFYMH